MFRKTIIDEIIPYAKEDPRIHLLVCDMGFGVIDNFKSIFPDRIINAGIREQGVVGIAAGMAISGMRPVVYSICNFLVYRAIEQIRNDVALQKLPVKFIGTGANDYFKFLGPSHCCGNDDIKLMESIGVKVLDPYRENKDFKELVYEWITEPIPTYIRV